MKFKFNINGKEYNIQISKENDKIIKIKVGNEEFKFREEAKEEIRIAKASLPKRNFKKKEIIAPITGEITEVFIKKGEFIKKEKKIVLLSAMKMENEIISDFEGKVKNVLVEKNQKVNKGDVLVVLD